MLKILLNRNYLDYELSPDNIHLNFSLNNNISFNNITHKCNIGDDLKLEVVINTIPNDTKLYNKYLSLEWRKDGKDLSKNKQFLIELNDSIASITIINAKSSNIGVYELIGQYFNITYANISIGVIINNMSGYAYEQSSFNGENKIQFSKNSI